MKHVWHTPGRLLCKYHVLYFRLCVQMYRCSVCTGIGFRVQIELRLQEIRFVSGAEPGWRQRLRRCGYVLATCYYVLSCWHSSVIYSASRMNVGTAVIHTLQAVWMLVQLLYTFSKPYECCHGCNIHILQAV
jgi:hypothetical protein